MAFIKTITDSDSNIIYPATEASAVFISGGGSSYTTLSSAMASINSKLDDFDGESQVESLPVASASNVGEIHQYIGTTSGDYIHGYFYECVYNDGVYSWVNRPVQNDSTGHTVVNPSGTEMTQRSKLQFSTGFTATDDSTNDKTVVTVNAMSGASSVLGGTSGTVPAPSAGDEDKFFKGDGTWSATPYPSVMTGSSTAVAGVSGLVPAPSAGDNDKCLMGDGTWGEVDSYTEWSGTQSQYEAATLAGTIEDGTIVTIDDAPSPAGSGGHTIINSSGTSMTERSGLQFSNCDVTDDSTNDRTIIVPSLKTVSDVYSTAKSYNIGDYCIYNNTLYKCIQAKAVNVDATPPNASYWTSTASDGTTPLTVATELAALNSGLTDNTEYNLFPVYTSATTDIYGNVNSSYVLTASSAPWGTGWEAHNAFQDYYHNWQSSNAKNQYIQYLNSGETLPLPAKKIAGYYVFASEPSVITRPVQCDVYINGSWHIIGSKTFTRTNGEAEKFEFEIDESLYPYIYGIKLSSTGTTAYTLSFSSLRLISR